MRCGETVESRPYGLMATKPLTEQEARVPRTVYPGGLEKQDFI